MEKHPERDSCTQSVWQKSVVKPEFLSPDFNKDSIYDTLIIGGGITGITTALLLQQAGQRCILAEGNSLGFGTTGGTSAHINTFFDATYPEIGNDFGEDAAKLIAEAGKITFSMITGFIEKYKIDCDMEYKDAYLFSENREETKQLKEIMEASQKAGIEVTSANENGVPISFQFSVLFKEQGQFNPLKYIYHLAAEFIKAGGIIKENTFIKQTKYEDSIHSSEAEQTIIKSKNIVYATHIPPGINLLNFRCAPYRSYVLGVKLSDEVYPKVLAYDMQEPYHYIRTHRINNEPYLIIGGEDHKTGHDNPEEAFINLENYTRTHFKVASVDYKWSAQYYVPVDGLPYIGQLPGAANDTYVATGYNGNGISFGTLAARIIADQILKIENPWSELLNPSRIKPIAGFTEFIKENADVAYHFVADRFSPAEIDSLKELKPDEGKIIKIEGQRLAVYKDQKGNITALNPICTHAHCIVNFNSAETSWDCPCHGGRFDINGKVLTGPPRENLQQIRL